MGRGKLHDNAITALAESGVSFEGSPPAYVKTTIDGGNKVTVDGILGKTVTAGRSFLNHYKICKGVGRTRDPCFYSTTAFNAPGVPSTLEFFDITDVNKSVVAQATIQCEKAKSVFKMLFDFAVDPVIAWIDSLIDNL